jgi:lysophospholipase L1-like esterase
MGTQYVGTGLGLGPLGYQQLGGAHSTKLQGWFAALANRNFAKTNIVCIGDSLTEGMGATLESYRWTERLRQLLNARFPCITQPVGGRGFLAPEVTSGLTSFSASYVTVTGTPTVDTGYGFSQRTYDISAGGGCTLAYSLVGDSADILWLGNSGNGSFRWKVDSGSYTTVSTNIAFSNGNITHVSLGTAGAHTLTINWLSGGSVGIDGVIEYNGDYASGIQVHNAGYFGSATSYWTSGYYPQPIANVNPGLIILELGSNDIGASISAATMKANLLTIIGNLRAAFTTAPPILLMAVYPNQGNDAVWPSYVAEYYAIAAADPLIDVIDLSLRMPATDATNTWGLIYSDSIHPSNKGQQNIADALCNFVSPA